MTIRKSATVEVMVSQSFNHFKTTLTLENNKGVTEEEINQARKDCQKLCDVAKQEHIESEIERKEKRKLQKETTK